MSSMLHSWAASHVKASDITVQAGFQSPELAQFACMHARVTLSQGQIIEWLCIMK